MAATSSVGRKVLRTNPSRGVRQRRLGRAVERAHDHDPDVGARARSRSMKASPSSISGRRGSTTTTSGCFAAHQVERRSGPPHARRRPRGAPRSPAVRQGSRRPDRPRRRRGLGAAHTRGSGSCIRAIVARAATEPGTDSCRGRGRPKDGGPSTSSVADRRGRCGSRRPPGSEPAATATASGTTTSMVVPLPGTLRQVNDAPMRGGRACIPASPRWPAGTRADRSPCRRPRSEADAVAGASDLEADLPRGGVLDDVVQRLLGDPVEGLLDRQRQSLVAERALDHDRQADPALERRGVGLERAGQPVLFEVARTQLEDQRAHLGERLALEVAELAQLGPGGIDVAVEQQLDRASTRGSSRRAPG